MGGAPPGVADLVTARQASGAQLCHDRAMYVLQQGDELDDPLDPYVAVGRRHSDGRCWVMANMVGTLSGSAAVGGRVGVMSQGPDAELFLRMRELADVVLVGAETVRREHYGPVRPSPELSVSRRRRGLGTAPPLAVVSRSLDLDWGARAFTEAAPDSRTIVITCESADPVRLERAMEAADVVVAGTDSVSPALALTQLHRMGHGVVLCEGGPTWLGELAAADLVDELCLTVTPLLGGDLLPVSVSPPGGVPRSLRLRHVLAADDTIFLRYERGTDER